MQRVARDHRTWHNKLLGPDAPARLATALHGALVRFVRDGRPGWNTYAAGTRPVLVFDEKTREIPDAFTLPHDRLRRAR
ncbi:carboxylesterase type B [Amycolatopsis lexingtonensis]|uniref:Carboxylesterase type B n=1 Tax=Amycolatopsis lexingtonensis TaxID=218822 RepID=A0ABR9HZ51_9PSEU|nr:hypothetical protein [Amycolatopsis lexingtonensis]MBE1496190.1 carboxylesterase type B [Amycolatopsis lexingtonensis]